MNADGTIGNDTPGSLQDPHVTFASFDLEGYLGIGFGIHIGVYRDRTTGNAGVFGAMDGGAGWGGSAGLQVGVARDLASFQGAVSIIGAGYRFISANYASAPGNLTSPVAVSAGPSVNLMPIINAPASVHGGRSYTMIQRSSLPLCPPAQ